MYIFFVVCGKKIIKARQYIYKLKVSSIFFFVGSLFTVAGITTSTGVVKFSKNDEAEQWELFYDFQERFSKKYDNVREVEERFQIFKTNVLDIIEHNLKSNETYTKGINQFTDLSADEFKEQYGRGVGDVSPLRAKIGSTTCSSFSGSGAKNAPATVDWRSENAVTPVKDQGQCGSCWSFSASGAMEGAWALSKGQLVSMSEQELVDCAGLKYGSMGCNGGLMEGAFNFAIDKGICAEASYAYTSGVSQTGGTCRSCASVATFSECFDVKPNDQVALKEAVSMQPVAIAIEADTRYFQSYSSGILTASTCGTTLDHGVLIVGYGEENGQKYWLVKNSWGTTWGDDGYVKIARSESTNDGGICGIAMQPSFISAENLGSPHLS